MDLSNNPKAVQPILSKPSQTSYFSRILNKGLNNESRASEDRCINSLSFQKSSCAVYNWHSFDNHFPYPQAIHGQHEDETIQ